MKISVRLWSAIKTSRRPAYTIAQEVGVHPSWLSKAMNGIEKVKPGDPRIIAVGVIVGVPAAECFDQVTVEKS